MESVATCAADGTRIATTARRSPLCCARSPTTWMPETLMAAPERFVVARDALFEITDQSTVGELISESVADDGVVTMLFAATMAGYPGWHWTVSVAELPDQEPT